MKKLFLGIFGGQNHLETVVADGEGNILGRGFSSSNDAIESHDKNTRLQSAVIDCVNDAMKAFEISADTVQIESAHCAVAGNEAYNAEAIKAVLKAENFTLGNDAPAALHGATGGKEGVVVIADKGSVAYGENGSGQNAKIGGWGHLFGDEGSGYWMGVQAVRRALKAEEGLAGPTVLAENLSSFFNCGNLNELVLKVYSGAITQEALASFTEQIHHAAAHGDKVAMQIIEGGARQLALLAIVTANKLEFNERIPVAVTGSVFRGKLTKVFFKASLGQSLPIAKMIVPRFTPAIGALMFAYRQSGIEITEGLLHHLETTARANV